MKVTEHYHICDLCRERIIHYSPRGCAMIEPIWNNQVIKIDEETVDICRSCCVILDAAKRVDLIDFSLAPFLESAGWEYTERGWERQDAVYYGSIVRLLNSEGERQEQPE